MATWILLFHLFFPTTSDVPASGDEVFAEGPRYRGIEALFIKFERERERDEQG